MTAHLDARHPERSGDVEWMEAANCLGVEPDLMFPGRGNNYDVQDAKAVCDACCVKRECLDYALAHGEKHGVWGGLSERQRRRIRRDMTAICALCDTEFRPVAGGGRRKYCSADCRRVAHNRKGA